MQAFRWKGKSHAISALMVYDRINQVKIGFVRVRSPSLNREGKVSAKCTLPPPHNMQWVLLPLLCCWMESLISFMVCVIISSLGGKIRLGARIGAWLVAGWDELHACLNPTMVLWYSGTLVLWYYVTIVLWYYSTMDYGTMNFTHVWTQLW